MAESQLYADFTNWLNANPDLIALTLACIAFAESFAIVGVIVPGVIMLGAASFVAGTGALGLPEALAATWFGAVLGDGISYLIGRRFHGAVRSMRPFVNHPNWINNAEALFKRYGWLSVVIGRFIGPIRPIIPMTAGALDMNTSLFFGINAVSALVWAPVYVLPGYLLGANIESGFDSIETVAGLILLVTMAGLLTLVARRLQQNHS